MAYDKLRWYNHNGGKILGVAIGTNIGLGLGLGYLYAKNYLNFDCLSWLRK